MENKNMIFIAIGIIVIAFALHSGTLFSASAPISVGGFSQWTGNACGSNTCDWMRNIDNSLTSSFQVGDTNYRFDTTVGGWGQCGVNSGGYVIQQCCQTTKVYRNNNLVDTLNYGYGGTSSSINSNSSQWTYYNDNTKLQGTGIPDRLGININLMQDKSFLYGCQWVRNDYQLLIPENSFDINIENPNTQYLQGSNISLNIDVTNNLIPTTAKLIVKFEAPTLIGSATSTQEKEVNLNKGLNTFSYSIPSDSSSSLLKVTPELIIDYPSNVISGVNYGFITGSAQKMSYAQSFKILDISEPTTDITIYGQNATVIIINNTSNCISEGCPSNAVCQSNGVCVLSNVINTPFNFQDFFGKYGWWFLGGGIVLVLILFMKKR